MRNSWINDGPPGDRNCHLVSPAQDGTDHAGCQADPRQVRVRHLPEHGNDIPPRALIVAMGKRLVHGPLTDSTAHLCIDMQNMFAEATPWRAPWMDRVRPVVANLARAHASQTIFTRFIPPARPEDMPGVWRRYFERWREMTRERLDPRLLELVPELAELVPPAAVIDKRVYSPFHDGRLLAYLRRRRVDSLVVSGAETDVCVLAAVLDAVDCGLRVVIAADALCSSADETHDALMKVYNSRFSQQVEVADTDTILAGWHSGSQESGVRTEGSG